MVYRSFKRDLVYVLLGWMNWRESNRKQTNQLVHKSTYIVYYMKEDIRLLYLILLIASNIKL